MSKTHMHGQNQSYLDLSVLNELRKHVLSQDAVVLFNADIDQILWANSAGAQLFGGRGVVDLLAATITDSQSIVRQLKDTVQQLEDSKSIIRGFRVNQGLRSLLIQFEIKRIEIYENEFGYKVTNYFDGNKRASENALAESAVDTLDSFADAAAILDDYGLPLSASKNFQELGPSEEILSALIAELKDEDDRLIKRPQINLYGNNIAIGLARIADYPGRNLIVVAEPDEEVEVATPESEAETLTPLLESAQETSIEETQEDILEVETTQIFEEDEDIEETKTFDLELEAPSLEETENLEDEASEEESLAQDTQEQELEAHEPEDRAALKYALGKNDGTVRFAWVIDEHCVFQSVSPELAAAVGKNAAAVVGREWREVANVFGFDTNHEIENLLKKQDTWSGKTVLWPVQGTDMVLPIDLAALPSFDSDRTFSGFRGFGIIRSADALVDPDETGLALDENPNPDDESNTPEETESNVVRLHQRGETKSSSMLSEQENYAFKKIGDTLRKDGSVIGSPAKNQEQVERAFISPKLETELEPELPDLPDLNEYEDSIPLEVEDFDETFNDEADNSITGLDTTIMENLPVAILVYNSDEVLFANQFMMETTGYNSLEELHDAGGIEAILASNSDDESIGNYSLVTRDGARLPINPVLKTVPWAGEKALLMSFNPSSKTVTTEPPALEMSSISEIQNILDITSDGILVLDSEGTIVSVNASAEALFNTSFDEAKDKNIVDLFAAESRTAIRQYVASQSSPGIENLFDDGKEVIAAEANGGMIPVFLTISKMQSSGKLCAVIRDMTSWKKAEEELIQSRHEAESASSQKTDFLAHISHEIRTPLNSIIGFSDIMIEERFGPINNERYREYLHDINRSGNHVLDLINDLLDLSKIQSGKLELEFEAIDLNEMVAETVALLQPQANGNRIIIRTSLSRAVPKVVADPRSIRQIILNLVSNAIKFSPNNSQVIVSTVYENNGEVALRIRDTGNGMTEAQIEDAMKPFHQVHKIGESGNEGSGLGLPLTKALVEANRALFDLESEPGQGTIAHVQFPTQRVLAD